MNKFTGTILTMPKMSGNVGAKTINIGDKGDDGATFIPSVSEDGVLSWTNDRELDNPAPVNIKGPKGDPGDDYILTEADKAEIAEMAAEMVEVPESGGDVDLTGYATEQYVQDYAQPKGDYLTAVPEEYAKTADIPTKPSDIGAQPEGDYALRSEIPSVPVQSVNGKTGAVQLNAADVGARPSNWMPTAQEVGALPDTYVPPNQTAAQVGADPAGTAAAAVGAHNTSTDAHNDLRLELKAINDRLNAFFDSDDKTLDELSEIVAYITSNKALIDSITTSKVSVADIINNLTTNVANKPLSAAQGVVIKGLIDGLFSGKLDASKLQEAINTALAQAKASGEFNGAKGKDGKTPVKGTDYFTDADKQEIAEMAAELIPGFVSTFAELKAATLNNVTPIVLAAGVTIEATEMLTFQAGTTLIGNGSTIKRASGHENKLLYLHRNCRVQDLVIDGNRSAMVSPTWETTIEVSTSSGCVVDNVTINDGNEAILVFGDNCVITNCNINNCGGNGIHFTGSNNTRVENCRVINANLRTDGSMGHEDGCIIWSNECDHIVCSNNWCEGGIAGFGSIDAAFNSHVKLIGNTVKDCTVAIDLVYQNKAPHDIVISGNTFIDSRKIDLYKNNSQIYVPGNISVNGNLFINTDAEFFHVTDVSMVGNIFKNGCPTFTRCARVTIANNTINNARDTAKNGVFANKCLNVVIEGNYVRAHKDILNVGYSTGVIVRNNNIRNVYSPNNTDYCINCNSVKNLLFDGNIVVLYRKGLNIPSYATITNNVILCSATGYNSLMLSNSTTNVLIRGNRIGGSKTFSTASTTNVVEGNDTGAFDDVFATVTMTLKNLTADAPAKATKGDEFAFTIVPNEGSTLPDTIAITNNGVVMDVNEYEYDNTTGEVLIHCVIGDVVITAETEGTGPSYTNLVPISIDTDGTIYNGTGYMNGKRLSSSGAVKDLSTSSVTGFIKAKAGDVVRLGGVVLASDPSSCYICAYDNSFALVGAKVVTGSIYGTDPATIVWDGTICTYTLANVSTIEYIRINAVCDGGPKGADMIVTVNEEITD